MKKLRPNGQRANVAISLLYSILAIQVIGLISDFFQYSLLWSIENGEQVSDEMAKSNDSRQLIIRLIYIAVSVASAITFISWFRRAYYNLGQLTNRLSYSEGWAAGCWFVPIFNLYAPYQIMNELWSDTNKFLTQKAPNYIAKQSNAIVIGWWITWLASIFINYFLSYKTKESTVSDFLKSTQINMFLSVVVIISAAITASMIRQYAAMETQLADVLHEEEKDIPSPNSAERMDNPDDTSNSTTNQQVNF